MKLAQIENAEKYKGLFVLDFGDSSSVGFTGTEVAEILESEEYKDVKVYEICRAYPDGRMELKGVPREVFELEAGMFFYAKDERVCREDFARLAELAEKINAPVRCKLQAAKLGESKYVTAIVDPAEYDGQVSGWLLAADFKTAGQAAGGVSAVNEYYAAEKEMLESKQLMASDSFQSRSGSELMARVKTQVQR